MEHDRETITCLRSVLMKPEHLDWLGRIREILDESVDFVIRQGMKKSALFILIIAP